MCILLHIIINCMLKSGPDRWEQVQVTLTPKCSSPSEFKPIHLILPSYHLGKVAELAVIDRL